MYFPAATKKGGMCMTTGPLDVCKTPAAPSPIPLPYPNIAKVSGTDGAIDKVVCENKPIVVESSKIPSSNGDEPGTVGGVKSNVNRDCCKWKKYSSKVFAKGKKVVHLTAMSPQNGSNFNTMGLHGVPSQTKVIVHM